MPMPRNDTIDLFDHESELKAFVIQVPTIPSHMDGQMVKELLEQHPDVEGIVVTENGCPAGVIMRTAYFQKIGSLYGHSLYMKRPVRILMDTEFMKVNITDNIARISIQAMSREQGKLYDYLVVYDNRDYAGVISIRRFLVELAKRNEAQISVLKNQQQRLLSAHEQETRLRKNLEYQSAAVRNLLDHADQGFLWFGEDLVIKEEYSYTCKRIFDKAIGKLPYLELVGPYFEEDKGAVFKMVLDGYFENESPVTDHVYLMLLPSDCLIGNKNIRFEYRRIESDGQKAVMVILNDMTEKVEMEKAMEDDRNRQRLLIKVFSCQTQIRQMMREFREIFSGGYRNFFKGNGSYGENLDELFRAVHTFKGDFAQYGFVSASGRLHEFEDALLAIVKRGASAGEYDVDCVMKNADPEKILEGDLNVIYDVFGKDYFNQSEVISIPKTKLMDVEKAIRDAGDTLDRAWVLPLLDSLKRKNIKVFISQYQDYLQYLADRVMKSMPVFLVEGDDIEIDPDQYGDFLKSLVHIFRNIMDHGIETNEERVERGKTEQGVVECKISRLDDRWFSLCISDDGRGIDLNKIREKAAESGLKSQDELSLMSKEALCSLIFADHFSTKDHADTLSGRGVGMAAVQRACQCIGGEIKITTEENKGTGFQIKLPFRGN